MNFAIAGSQLILPLLFVIAISLQQIRLILVVSVDAITVGTALVVRHGAALHILKVVVHLYVAFRIYKIMSSDNLTKIALTSQACHAINGCIHAALGYVSEMLLV